MMSMDSNLIKYLYKTLLFVALLLVIDFAVGNAIHYLFSKQKSGSIYRTLYSMDNTRADILIFGSSTASHSYKTSVFRELFPELTSYNCGNDGSSIFYHYAVLKMVLKRHTPKVVILDFIPGEFRFVPGHYEKLSYLLPFVKGREEFLPVALLRSPFENIKLLSKTYPYNSLLVPMLGGVFNIHSTNRSEDNGYVALQGQWDYEIGTDSLNSYYQLDSCKVNYFNAFIDDCLKAETTLYISCSPSYVKHLERDNSVLVAKEIARREEIKFFDFTNDTSFINNRHLFRDIAHLNDAGADKYTRMLISQYIRNK